MSSPSAGSTAETAENPAASTALTLSIIALLTAPLWILAGLFFKAGGLILAAIPGLISLVLAFKALGLAYAVQTRPGGKRSIMSLVLGLLAFVISLLSSGLGAALTDSKIGKMDGRALRIRGRPVTARRTHDDAWSIDDAPAVPVTDTEARAMLATAWETDARTEHASIAAFARLSLDLIAEGAPPQLVEASLSAALDEVRHATGAYSLASAYAGRPQGPGPLPEVMTAPGGLSRLATETLVDGCLGEGLAAACAREAAAEAVDPVVKAHLCAVARDEGRHAELAWAVLAFCLARGGAPVRLVTERALASRAPGLLPVPESAPSLEGRLPPARIAALGGSVWLETTARARRLMGELSGPDLTA